MAICRTGPIFEKDEKTFLNDVLLFNAGSIVHTGMQNELGGYENDCSVARLAENHFMLMSPSIQQMRSYSWMKHRLPADGSVYLQASFSLPDKSKIMWIKILNILHQMECYATPWPLWRVRRNLWFFIKPSFALGAPLFLLLLQLVLFFFTSTVVAGTRQIESGVC